MSVSVGIPNANCLLLAQARPRMIQHLSSWWHGGIIIGLCVFVENGGADQTFSQRKEGGLVAWWRLKQRGSTDGHPTHLQGQWLYHFQIQTQIAISTIFHVFHFHQLCGSQLQEMKQISGGVFVSTHLPKSCQQESELALQLLLDGLLKKLFHNKADVKKQSNCKLTRGICPAMWQ